MFIEGITKVIKGATEYPVLVEVVDGKLFIASYTDFHSIVFECDTEWEDFKFVLSAATARQLPKIIGNQMKLEVGSNVTIEADGVSLKLTTLDPDNSMSLSQHLTKYPEQIDWIVASDDLKGAFTRIKHSSLNATIGDIVLKGYHMTRKGDKLEVMASNGPVLSVANILLLSDSTEMDGMFLLNQEFHNLVDLLSSSEKVSIGFTKDTIGLRNESGDGSVIKVVSALTKGTSFEYQKVLDNVVANPIQYTFSTKDMLKAYNKNHFFTNASLWNRVTLILSTDSITITSNNTYGEANTTIPVSSNATKEIEIAINGNYLSNYLAKVSSSEITLAVKDAKSPIIMTDEYETEVILPISLPS